MTITVTNNGRKRKKDRKGQLRMGDVIPLIPDYDSVEVQQSLYLGRDVDDNRHIIIGRHGQKVFVKRAQEIIIGHRKVVTFGESAREYRKGSRDYNLTDPIVRWQGL